MLEMTLLDENDVVSAVRADLERHGWRIVSFCTTAQTGVDIEATKESRTLLIEAKGITSSVTTSKRYGQIQTGTQIFIQIAAALLKTVELRQEHDGASVAMAIPDHPVMRKRIAKIDKMLDLLSIGIIWVGDDETVTYDGLRL